MSKEVTYKCDICTDTCTEEILKGFIIGINGMGIHNNVKDYKQHICHRCIAYIADWKENNTIGAEYDKEKLNR